MTMSKVQFAALMLLTASLVGIGVGWLPRYFWGNDRSQPPDARIPFTVSAGSDSHGERKPFLAEGGKEREDSSSPHESEQPATGKDKAPVRYQGKPASTWLELFRDRDPEYREKAIDPLAAIAKVDRSVIPVLIEGLKDKNGSIRKDIARCLDDLNPPAPETVPVLFHADLELDTVLPLLKKIDPTGAVTLPLVRAALQDKQLRVRAGLILIAFDKMARLPIPLLVEALEEGTKWWLQGTCYYPPGDKDDVSIGCSQKVLAAWLLRQAGVEVRQAVPALVEALQYALEEEDRWADRRLERFQPFETALRTRSNTDWFAATLTVVDPQGEDAIPSLMARLKKEETDQEQRRNLVRALGRYGVKAQAAVPVLLDIMKSKGAQEKASNSSTSYPSSSTSSTTVSRSVENPRPALYDVTVEVLNKINPKALNTKEPPLAESSKPAKQSN